MAGRDLRYTSRVLFSLKAHLSVADGCKRYRAIVVEYESHDVALSAPERPLAISDTNWGEYAAAVVSAGLRLVSLR